MSELLRAVRCKCCQLLVPEEGLEEHMEDIHPLYLMQVRGYLREQDEKVRTFERVVEEQERGNPVDMGDSD